ncbi:hypothetical protein CMQ_2106 [Grosmannia clavigera kw1407]|uniref:ER-bound oxygenase mpaB/mpaB'/Rubber oxygenase catalytic domain-containing protein n=1 Tax=Grosmannia clavigera (strain kw1407 / UAMH 11150) TaxID=655863 RepID=F0XJM5_GROCL|nr:uncharacterized protein CMQ_2106 [Grosmannia clavigera kw1407]EFX02057.1 hypothetical protein CMQ_2106 [Grosmannia clavigera kw1407]
MNGLNTTAAIADGKAGPLGWPGWPGWIGPLVAVVAGYVVLCSCVRFRFEKAMQRRFGYTDRASLARMTNDDAQAILQYIIQREFPQMYNLSLQFGIFKTYGFATVSKLLVATRALTDPQMAGKRYEDTVVIFSEFSLNPPTSDRCLQALARMNYLHERYRAAGQIDNADLLYTLAACVTEPIRFLRLYEWRPLNAMERCALGVFWKSIGDAMGIGYDGHLARGASGDWRDGLAFVDDLTAWAAEHERAHMRPDVANTVTSRRLVDMLLHQVPQPLRPLAVEALTVLMGQRMREAFLYPEPGIVAATATYGALMARRFVLRYLALPRFAPVTPLSAADPTTGRMHLQGGAYLVEPWYQRPTRWARWGPAALLRRLLGGLVPADNDRWMAGGYRFEDIGPQNRMGQGVAEAAAEVDRLRQKRPSGCPFA